MTKDYLYGSAIIVVTMAMGWLCWKGILLLSWLEQATGMPVI